MSQGRRRACVEHVTAKLEVSERFVCKALDRHRSTQRKGPRTTDDEVALTAVIIDWARQLKRGRLWLNDGSCVRLRPERANHAWAE